MGVNGLNRFIQYFEKGVIDSIKIRDEIAKWKREHSGDKPVILIDLKDCPDMFVQNDQIGVILGGHYDRYNKMMHIFLDNITMAGARLVFFVPGHQQTDDLPIFIPKTEERYIESLDILDTLKEKAGLKGFLRKKNHGRPQIHMELSFNYNLKRLVSDFGDFHVTYEEHNQQMARYAVQMGNKMLAIISNNSDFVAFSDGAYEFWYANSVNFIELTCHRYNTDRLYDKLGFYHGTAQMQLLSALTGSIYLPYCAIKHFHDRLAKNIENPNQRGKIWNVSAYVKRQPFTMQNKKMVYDLEQISRDVFGEDFSREQLNAISNGLEYYNLDFGYPLKRDSSDFLRFCKQHNSFAYKLATDYVFIVRDLTYMDYRNYKSKGYAKLIMPILMKMCGILLKDDVIRPIHRKICVKHAHDEPSKVTEEVIIYPLKVLPEQFEIQFKSSKQQHDEIRRSLLEWALDFGDGTVKEIQNTISCKRFAVVILTLQYLIQQHELTAKEANIILYTEHQIRNLGLKSTVYPEHPNADYVRIAHLYVKMYVLISHCMEICGLYHMTGLLCFDGPIFHKNMEKFNATTGVLTDLLHSTIQPIWTFS